MFIRELDIDGFGVFAEQRLALGAGLNVVFGDNEAGKSTLLAFVRTLLFGFPDGRSRDDPHAPLRGGAHGGRMLLETAAAERYTLERRPGPRGGLVALTNGTGAASGERLRDLLGATSRELFRNVYAFSLSELQTFETLHADGVRASLYGASIGVSVLALPRVQADLERQSGDLYKPNGTQPALNLKLAESVRLERELHTAGDTIERYAAVSARLDEIRRELEDRTAESRARQRQRRDLESLLRLWPSWLEWLDAGRRLGELPAAPVEAFPADALRRLDVLVAQRAERHHALAAARMEVAEREGDATRESGDSRRTPGRAETAPAETALQSLLEQLGAEWTPARLRTVDRSLFTRETIRAFQADLEKVRDDCREANVALDALPTGLPALAAQVDRERAELRRSLEGLGADWTAERVRRVDLSPARLTRLGDLERALDAAILAQAQAGARLEAARERVASEAATTPASLEPGRRATGTIGFLLVGLAAIAAVLAALVADGVLPEPEGLPVDARTAAAIAGVAAVGVALLAAALVARLRRQRTRTEQGAIAAERLAEAERATAAAAERLVTATEEHERADISWRDEVESMGFSGAESPKVLHSFVMPAVDAARQRLTRVADAERQLEREGGELERGRVRADDRRAAAAAREDEVRRRWRAWLEAAQMPAHLSPETALEALQLVTRALEAADAAAARRAELEARLGAARRALEGCAAALAETEARIAALVRAAGARDEEDLRRRAAVEDGRAALRQIAAERERAMIEISDAGDFEILRARLRGLRRGDVEGGLQGLDEELAADEARVASLRDERARLDLERGNLASCDDVARLRGEQERLRAEMKDLAHAWSRAAIARHLLEEAKGRFERERQPQVLRDASVYLERMTEGRYRRVRATLDADRPLEVEHADGTPRRPEQLSRGTQEQLYLALRFGYVLNHDVRGEPLPVVMDEVLVNFDPGRAALAAEAIAELSRRRQILYFTCHPSVRELFAACAPDAVHLRLADGRLA